MQTKYKIMKLYAEYPISDSHFRSTMMGPENLGMRPFCVGVGLPLNKRRYGVVIGETRGHAVLRKVLPTRHSFCHDYRRIYTLLAFRASDFHWSKLLLARFQKSLSSYIGALSIFQFDIIHSAISRLPSIPECTALIAISAYHWNSASPCKPVLSLNNW